MNAAKTRNNQCLSGELGRILWSDPQSGFSIARLRMDSERVWVIKGDLGGIKTGERVELHGKFVEDSRWGRQFRVQTARPVLPTTGTAIARYLDAIGIPGIGKRMAERIVEVLGAETLTVIAQSPERLSEVKGLGPTRREALIDSVAPRLQRDAALLYLHGLDLSPWQVRRVQEVWSDDAVRLIRANPYCLQEVTGLGFVTADRVARGLGVPQDSPQRIDAALVHAVDALAQQGHTLPHGAQVDLIAVQVLRDTSLDLVSRRHALVKSGVLVAVDDHVASARLDREERLLAKALRRLAEGSLGSEAGARSEESTSSEGTTFSARELDERLALAQKALNFQLEGAQRQAISAAMTAGLLVVTGGPGTGKTTLIQGVLAALAPSNLRIALAAPTGRAARRLSEATGVAALTLHRLLEVEPHTMKFTRNAAQPLEADLVIVDESSMLDVRLARYLCEAVAPHARLLLVGDVDQLPSVGPGAVLHDLIKAQICTVIVLEEVHRQAARSTIVRNAHRVRRGVMPISDRPESDGDFFLVPRSSADAMVETVVEIVANRLPQRYGFDPLRDIQVLVPMHRGAVGTVALNEALRAALVPDDVVVGDSAADSEQESGQRLVLRAGEKVIQQRNNYDLEIYNGDIGRVIDRYSTTDGRGLRVRFGDRDVNIPMEAWRDLRPAYAITVHKSQGSEYDAVVLVLHPHHHLLLQRNLVYTAITRARRFCVVVGSMDALDRAVRNAQSQRRSTQLYDLLCTREV